MALVSLAGCASGPTESQVATAHARHDAFTDVCYAHAHETVRGMPANVREIYLSLPSPVVGLYDFELFFGLVRPRHWAGAQLIDGPALRGRDYEAGAYELRYTYLPVERVVEGSPVSFKGVRQELFDLQTGEVIAERENYLYGRDFNRSTICIDADWFQGNANFADRLFGYRYRDESPRTPPAERYVKAIQQGSRPVDIELPNYPQQDALPAGTTWNYNDRKVTLRNGGSFHMPSYWNAEPLPDLATLETEAGYVFVMLPDGHARNWPLRQLLLFYRDKNGSALKKVFIQIPRFVDWSNGWGMRPQDVSITPAGLQFSVYGRKQRTSQYSDQPNAGHYLMRYDFTAQLPD